MIILLGGCSVGHHFLHLSVEEVDLDTLNEILTPSIIDYPIPILSSFDYEVTPSIVPEKTRRPNHLRRSRKLFQ